MRVLPAEPRFFGACRPEETLSKIMPSEKNPFNTKVGLINTVNTEGLPYLARYMSNHYI